MRIVIVEDERNLARAIERCLVREGHVIVATAETYEEAVERINTHKPEIVITDYHFPGGTGLQVMDQALLTGAKVIGMTADPHGHQTMLEYLSYFEKVLAKPFDMSELIEALQ